MKMFASVLLTLLLTAHAQAAGPRIVGDPKRAQEVLKVFQEWNTAHEVKNIKRLMAVYDASIVFSSPGDLDKNFEQLKADYITEFSASTTHGKWKPYTQEVYSEGTLTFVVSRWEYREKNEAGKEEVTGALRSMDVFRQTKAGFKIVRTINYAEPVG